MSANGNIGHDIPFHPSNESGPQDAATEPHHLSIFAEISIGYTKKRRSYLDKQTKAASTEAQLRALQGYHHLHFSSTERFIARWIFCQKPIVQVAELNAATEGAPEAQRFPREVQFEKIGHHQVLSTGLLRPETLQESGRMFYETNAFDVVHVAPMGKKKVLCIAYTIEKKRLVWPLLISIGVALVSAAVTGTITRSLGPSVELGAFVGVVFGLLWSFVMWLLE